MLPETSWRPSRLMARLRTPLVCPRNVKTSSLVRRIPELDGSVVAGCGEPPAAGKIGDGADQARVSVEVAGFSRRSANPRA